jgi:hypothetical protein
MSTTPETAEGWWEPGDGTRIDGHVVYWRALKRDAVADAKSIGWPANSVWPVHTRFQDGYAIAQPCGGYLTRSAFAALLADRNAANNLTPVKASS